MSKPVVAVLTSAHPAFDTRIFHKECKSLVQAGYDVVLIVPNENAETRDGVRVHNVRMPTSRRQRMFCTPFDIYRAVQEESATICHFHDPELIPVAILLKLRGRRVVYDVHENLSYDILEHKPYIPKLIRRPLSLVARILERGVTVFFDSVIAATPQIATCFAAKNTTLVQNFPVITQFTNDASGYGQRPFWISFAGMISELRGIREMIQAMGLFPEAMDVRLKLVGKFDPESLEHEMRALPGWNRVDFLGWQSRDQVDKLLPQCRLGLVTYHSGKSHDESMPNKLFEYMSMGLPVVASNFPLWREIVEGAGCGLVVDPLNSKAIASAMQWLLEHPAEAEEMGQRGLEAVHLKYNWNAEAAKLLALYRTLSESVR